MVENIGLENMEALAVLEMIESDQETRKENVAIK